MMQDTILLLLISINLRISMDQSQSKDEVDINDLYHLPYMAQDFLHYT